MNKHTIQQFRNSLYYKQQQARVVFEMRWTYPKVSQEILATQWRISELG
jgi:hypothetical protein